MTEDWLNSLLVLWAIWARKRIEAAGYRGATIEYTLMRYGGECPRGQGLRPEPSCELEEQVDAAIMLLGERKGRDIQIVLITHYLARGTVKQKARDLSLNINTYFHRLRIAKAFLEGCLARLAA